MMLFSHKNHDELEIIKECIEYYELNDLYLNQDQRYQHLKTELLSSSVVDFKALKEFIHNTRGNKYTDFLIGAAYSNSSNIKEHKHFNYRLLEEFLYINLSYFTKKSVEQALKIINQYKDRPNLILDLRNSPGGYIDACMAFCRFLIKDKKELVTLYYKNKNTTYYSENQAPIAFKGIYIFVNEQTASCSEITALTLKTSMESVRLIGERTKGKECGQEIIVNKSKGFSMIIASFIWKCGNYGIKELQQLIDSDVEDSIQLVTDDDFFRMVLV